MSLKFIITFQAKTNTIADFLKIMQQVKTDLPMVDGCHDVQVLRNIDNPCVFTLVETWENKESHQENSKKLQDSGSWDHIIGLLASEPDGSYFSDI